MTRRCGGAWKKKLALVLSGTVFQYFAWWLMFACFISAAGHHGDRRKAPAHSLHLEYLHVQSG